MLVNILQIQKKLQEYKAMGKIDFQLTPMNTLIEGELSDVLEVVQVMNYLLIKV